MVKLGREMTRVLIEEYGPDEFIKRIADPAWFQSLGTVLAFDWNSSGLTTILTAALKEAIKGRERDLGIFICGGKGKTSKKTPEEIISWGERGALAEETAANLVYNSKMSAKVDSALVQDGFQLYHHSFFFSKNGAWAVVQQGMNQTLRAARRYHWHSETARDIVCEPHAGISSTALLSNALNLVAKQSEKTRKLSTELVRSGFKPLMKEITLLRKYYSPISKSIAYDTPKGQLSFLHLENVEFKTHPVIHEDFAKSKYLERILSRVTEISPENYEKLLAIEGVGPKTMRALALVAEVIYGARPSYEDPARYSFAHGGKDATPYPVHRQIYDQTIAMMERAIKKTTLSIQDKNRALKRLHAN